MMKVNDCQQEALDALLVELQGYKQASQSSQAHISQLEAKNASLRGEIRLLAGGSAAPASASPALLPPPPSAVTARRLPHTTLAGELWQCFLCWPFRI